MPDPSAKLPAQPNQGLIDGLAVLQALAASPEPIGSREAARRLGLEPTRANRLLKTLAALGLVRQRADRRYEPGPAMHVLSVAAMNASGLLRVAVPRLEALRHEPAVAQRRLQVALGVLWRDSVCYLFQAAPGLPIEQAFGNTSLYPAEQSGIGMALLARQPDAEIRDALGERATTVWPALRDAREHGWAYVAREDGSASLGVAVGAPPAAAIAIAGRLSQAEAQSLAPLVRQAAEAITALL